MLKEKYPKHYEKLKEMLVKMRKDAGLTQVGLAEKLKVRQQFVSKYETGERNLDFVEVCLVCKACGQDIEYLKIDL